MVPTRIVGSGTGANLLECTLGSGVPVLLLSAILAGSTAPCYSGRTFLSHSRNFGPHTVTVRPRAPCPYFASSFTSK